jgi:hypothetical protein
MPDPAYPDHHFMFDRPKLDMYVARIYAFLSMSVEAEHYARRVIDQAVATDNRGRSHPVPPTRESFGRLDLASALIVSREPEEASKEATRSLDALLRNDVVQRAGEIDAKLTRSFPDVPQVVAYHERYIGARNALGQGEV